MTINERGRTSSNLERFLEFTTPIVPSQTLPKRAIENLNQLWHSWEKERVEYFTLGDLWRCYDEWSAYGAGVPISLNNVPHETVVQYYVPYLSAIQIFTSTPSSPNFREDGEAGDYEIRELFSDSCSDHESESSGWSQDYGSDQGVVRTSNLHNDKFGELYFQYNERSAPYGRVPLVAKINELAQRFPQLMTLKSTELSPASWMAVAWYPIYHIPTRRTIKSLSTCFLTFHTLSSSLQDNNYMGPLEQENEDEKEEEEEDMGTIDRKMTKGGIQLSPFGLATYKMQGSMWISNENGEEDQERLVSMVSAADSWLKQLRVQHHDFTYFTGIHHA